MVKSTIDQEQLRLKAIELESKDDLERDKMVQDRVIRLAEIQAKNLSATIKEEQKSNESLSISKGDSGSGEKST